MVQTADNLEGNIERLSAEKTKLNDEYNGFVDKVNDAMSSITTGVVTTVAATILAGPFGGLVSAGASYYCQDEINEIMDDLTKAIQEIIDAAQVILDCATPVVSLIGRAKDWVTTVQGQATDKSGRAAVYCLHANAWSGLARDVYDQRIPQQTLALDGLASAAGSVGAWLTELAAANAEYIMSLIDPIVNITAEIVGLAIEAGTIVGILSTIQDAAGLIQGLITDMWEAVKNAINLWVTVAEKEVQSESILSGMGESWPQMINA